MARWGRIGGAEEKVLTDGEDGVVFRDTIQSEVSAIRAKKDDIRGRGLAGFEIRRRGRCLGLREHQGESERDKCGLHDEDGRVCASG